MLKCGQRKCDGDLKAGKALRDSTSGFGRPNCFGTTTGQPKLVNVMKCEECGYSRTMTDVEEFYTILRKIGFPLNDHAQELVPQKDPESLWGIKAIWEFKKIIVMECDEGFRINEEYYNGFEVLEKLAELYPWVARKLAEPS